MDEQAVLPAGFQGDLPGCLDKRLGFDVSDRAADLRDDHVGVRLSADTVDKFLDLVCDMRYHLYGRTEILAAALLIQYIPVDLSRRQVRVFVQILIDKALIMSQIKVRFGSVLRYIDLSVLIGAHGSRIHIDVRVQLLCGNFQAARLQQPSQRSRCDPFSQTRYDASGHKNVLCHISPPLIQTLCKPLFDCYALGQVTRLIHVQSFRDTDIVCQQLQRDHRQQAGKVLIRVRDRDHVVQCTEMIRIFT